MGVISVFLTSRCGCWVWSLGGALNDMISGHCVFIGYSNLTTLPYISRSIIIPTSHFIFFKNVFVCYNYIYLYNYI